jgi:hemerythrin-like metal-binding protein
MKTTIGIEWDDRYLTGIDHLDDQHKELIRVINTICRGISGDGQEEKNFFRQSVFRLSQYLKYHFGEEQQFMERTNYPDISAHVKQHENFMIEMFELIKRAEMDRFFSPAAMIRYLRDSILTHITIIDRKYATFIHVLNSQSAYRSGVPHAESEKRASPEYQSLPTEAFIG